MISTPFSTSFWQDRYVRGLDRDTKDVYIFLITSHRLTLSGIYEVTISEIAKHALCDGTKHGVKKTKLSMKRLIDDGKILYSDDWVFLLNRVKHQAFNPSVKKGLLREIDSLRGRVPTGWEQAVDRLVAVCRDIKIKINTYSDIETIHTTEKNTSQLVSLSMEDFTREFLRRWNQNTKQNYQDIKPMEKVLRKTLRTYTRAELLNAADKAGDHPFWKNQSPYLLTFEKNRKGYQDPIGDILTGKRSGYEKPVPMEW